MPHIPADLPGGLTREQCDTILSLVAIAENSTTRWGEKFDYCENIKDGRGYTVSIVGFCSGTSDLLWVVERLAAIEPGHPLVAFLPALRKVNGSDSTKGLKEFGEVLAANCNESWKRAVWDGIVHHYWQPAMEFAAKMGCRYAITKGFLYDLALNHGASEMGKMAKRLAVGPPSKGGDEKEWLSHLIWQRSYIIKHEQRSTNSGQTDRCDMWNSILETGNVDLTRPITGLRCYGERFTIE
jgi:chitosanase